MSIEATKFSLCAGWSIKTTRNQFYCYNLFGWPCVLFVCKSLFASTLLLTKRETLNALIHTTNKALLQRMISLAVGHKYLLHPGNIIGYTGHRNSNKQLQLNYNKDNADTTNNPISESNLYENVHTPAKLAHEPHRGSLHRSQSAMRILPHSHAQRHLL